MFVGQVIADKDFIFLPSGERRHGRATVQPVAVLKGRTPGGPIDLQLGPAPDCRGNPNLNLDERVLLFLKQGSLGGVAIQDPDKWYSPFNGYAKYLFKDGLAYREALPHIDNTTGLLAVGGAGDLLRKVASRAGPRLPWEEDQTVRAIRFAEGDEDHLSMGTALSAQPLPTNPPGAPVPLSVTPIPAFLIVGGSLLGLAVLLWLRGRAD